MPHIEIEPLLQNWIQELGFSHGSWTRLENPISIDFYEEWLSKKHHGEMNYLENHLPLKKKPQEKFPFAKSYLSFAQPYWPTPAEAKNSEVIHPRALRVALYAGGSDYHHWFKKKLDEMISKLQTHFPNEIFLSATDSQPLLERDMAYRAGLGWYGKNTCIIHPQKGSLFFLGEILTSLDIGFSPSPLPDFCGTCQRCIDVCPTGAIQPKKELQATKCISYWTIESKTIPPVELREKFGDHFFGCDLCQTVCPWNQKVFKNELEVRPQRTYEKENRQNLIDELKDILQSSSKKIEKKWFGSPLSRARGFGLKRNALIVIGNNQIDELADDVRNFLREEKNKKLFELAEWCLRKLNQDQCES